MRPLDAPKKENKRLTELRKNIPEPVNDPHIWREEWLKEKNKDEVSEVVEVSLQGELHTGKRRDRYPTWRSEVIEIPIF